MYSPRTTRRLQFSAIAFVAGLLAFNLTSCSVSPSGPIGVGAAHGSLASDNMCDYYYKKSAGWTYAFQNVENVYNSDGSVTTLTGAPDTVRTLGYSGIAPCGDSLYRFAITYRVSSTYAGRGELTMNYISNCNNQNGAWVDNGVTGLTGEASVLKKPRPVSTDTILAGLIGRIRTSCDDFSNTGSYVWQTDTIWASAHNDSVFVWESFPGSTTLNMSRCIFTKDFVNNTSSNGTGSNVNWQYDLIFGTTFVKVDNANVSITVPAGTFASTAQLEMTTNDPSLGSKYTLPCYETKYFSYGVGFSKEYDYWWVTTDGKSFTKQDFTRSLISLTYNSH